MSLFLASLTGADDAVDPAALVALHREFPKAEFGILIQTGFEGLNRFPTLDWIERFLTIAPDVPKALHVCGESLNALFSGDTALLGLADRFGRVQLNIRAQSDGLADKVKSFAHHYHGKVITQHHPAVENLWREVDAPNHQLLFDGSAGTGKLASRWDAPLVGKVCGYAGGLKPENIEVELPRIEAAAGEVPFWIDLESGLRDANDHFSLERTRQFLSLV